MSGDRTIAALDRIASAMDRIERAQAQTSGSAPDLRLPELSSRHAKLRNEAQAVLLSLDALISAQSGADHG
jgi:hypothetical protein